MGSNFVEKNSSCSKLFCINVKLTKVYYSYFSLRLLASCYKDSSLHFDNDTD